MAPVYRYTPPAKTYAGNVRGGLRQLIDTAAPTQQEIGALEHIHSGLNDVRAFVDLYSKSATTPAVVEFLEKLDRIL